MRPPAPRPRAADRVGLQPWLLASLVVAAGVCLAVAGEAGVARHGLPPQAGAGGGVVMAGLAVLGLPSISVRLVTRLVVVISAGLLIRFGVVQGSAVSGSQSALAWVVGAVGVFVLTDRVGTDAQLALAPSGGRARVLPTARTFVAAALAVVVLAVVLTPAAMSVVGSASAPGDGPRLEGTDRSSASLRSSKDLDMTQRPDPTDEVLFTVATNRATFWRGETFDRWDGRRWTRSQPQVYAVPLTGLVANFPDDLGASGQDEFSQEIRIETSYADVLFAAPSAVQVDVRNPVAQRADGTFVTSDRALGRGATYRIRSRQPVLSEARLRAARGIVPADLAARDASAPVTTDRVRAAARAATAGATTTYDKVVALERWMGRRTEYSIDAPLSPGGVDVVDHFLFESRRGWCEQIASSLVVLARANGIPARLATGFVPDEFDRVTGRYIVRARDAHAWAEVWFPQYGWVPFDPTANVPLAGTTRTDETWAEWFAAHAVVLLLAAAAMVVIAISAMLVLRRWRGRARPVRRSAPWAARADARLGSLGDRVGRERAPSESAHAYATALAERIGDARLVSVGRAIDDALFAAEPPPPERCRAADAVLDELADRDLDLVPVV